MEKFQGRIGIIGAGALGALYGARISRAGYDVHFLLRSDYDAVKANGLEVQSFQGNFKIQPPIFRNAEEMGVCDLLIIGLKSTQNAAFPGLLRHVAGPETVVLTLQNGLGNEEAIESALEGIDPGSNPRERILGGIAFLCSNRIAPGVIHHIEYGKVRMAEFSGQAKERTHRIAELFREAEFPCEVADSLMAVRWEKLIWNIPFNGMGVAAEEADTHVVLHDEALHATAYGIMEEVIAAAKSDGVKLGSDLPAKMMGLSTAMGPYRSSMQIDFEEGRPLEVEAILGEPVRRAKRAGIDVPRMEMLYGIVRRRDALRQSGSAHTESERAP